MRNSIVIAAAVAFASVSAPAFAVDPPAAQPAAKYTTASSDMGTLLDNPATKAILQKHVAWIVESEQISMARAMTLKQIQGMVADRIPDSLLAAIDAELAKVK